MKWKTAVLFIILAFFSIMTFEVLNNFLSSLYWQTKGREYVSPLGAEDIDRFAGNITIVNGVPRLNPKLQDILNKINGWIIFLDENAQELSSFNKPGLLPAKVNINRQKEIIHKLSAEENLDIYSKNYSISIINNDRKVQNLDYTYIMGIPRVLAVNYLSVNRIFSFFTAWDNFKIASMIITFFLIAIIGYFYASRVLPYNDVIEGLTNVVNGDYSPVAEKGIYRDIYKNMNKLSGSLLSEKSLTEEINLKNQKRMADLIHELKNSSAIIKGYAEILTDIKSRSGMDEESKYAEIIYKNSNKMEQLLDDINSGTNL
ncbi:MAG: hypothetical protein Q8920_02080 [Bacillota bacterium]|nr:hypothetical protein [Bacillota bacterium]